MNKLTKKLFRYFTVLEMFLIIIVFLGFSLVFHHYTTDLHEKQLKERVETISARLEEFADSTSRQSGRGAYLKFLDDISMADTYIVSSDGKPFSFGNNHMIVNEPTEEILKIAEEVFQADSFLKKHEKSEDGKKIIYVGMPVKQGQNIIASVVIRDEDTFDREGFLQAVVILGVCLGLSLILSLAFGPSGSSA